MTDEGVSGVRASHGASLLDSSLPYLVPWRRRSSLTSTPRMSPAKKNLSTTRSLQSAISRQNDPCSDEMRSVQADVQLMLEIHKRKKALETFRPRTASVTPTLNLALARARDTVRTLAAQLQNDTGENTQIRMYAIFISDSLISSTL